MGIMELTRWQLIHEYMRRARLGEFDPLECMLCDGPVAPLDKDDTIVLWCPSDDSEETVGIALLDNIKEQIGAVYI